MSNEFYDHGSYPQTGAPGSSAAMRAELESIEGGFDKLPTMAGNGGKFVKVKADGSGLETGDVAVAAGNVAVTPVGGIAATDVQAALAELDTEKAAAAHSHAISDVTGLQTELNGKASAGNVPVDIAAATAKTTPVDADAVGIVDSEASGALKKLTWANIKATLKTYFDTIYTTLANVLVTANAWQAQQTPFKGTLTDGATIDWNGNTHGQSVKLTTAAARTFNAPTNIIEDNLYVLRLTTGGFTPAWNAAYKWATAPASLENATYVFTFIGGPSNTLLPTGGGYKTGA